MTSAGVVLEPEGDAVALSWADLGRLLLIRDVFTPEAPVPSGPGTSRVGEEMAPVPGYYDNVKSSSQTRARAFLNQLDDETLAACLRFERTYPRRRQVMELIERIRGQREGRVPAPRRPAR